MYQKYRIRTLLADTQNQMTITQTQGKKKNEWNDSFNCIFGRKILLCVLFLLVLAFLFSSVLMYYDVYLRVHSKEPEGCGHVCLFSFLFGLVYRYAYKLSSSWLDIL